MSRLIDTGLVYFFKASIWLWQNDGAFELLVRRSFMGYVWLMLERASQECGLVTWRARESVARIEQPQVAATPTR